VSGYRPWPPRSRGGYGAPLRRQPGQPAAGPRVNRFDAPCATCGATVPAGTGHLAGRPGAWTVTHAPAVWKGSPCGGALVGTPGHGGWVGGCPASTGPLSEPLSGSEPPVAGW
jgi:hypothetical protein